MVALKLLNILCVCGVFRVLMVYEGNYFSGIYLDRWMGTTSLNRTISSKSYDKFDFLYFWKIEWKKRNWSSSSSSVALLYLLRDDTIFLFCEKQHTLHFKTIFLFTPFVCSSINQRQQQIVSDQKIVDNQIEKRNYIFCSMKNCQSVYIVKASEQSDF